MGNEPNQNLFQGSVPPGLFHSVYIVSLYPAIAWEEDGMDGVIEVGYGSEQTC